MSLFENKVVHEFEIDGTKCSFSTGYLARRSKPAVFAKMGDTAILATVNNSPASESATYFPLQVEFLSRMYAGGVISSSRFVKREGHPSAEDTLNARMIDRSIRPMFPDDYRDEVQVIVTVLSYDAENDPAILAMNAVSAGLMLSETPFDGPVSGVRVGYDGEEFYMYNRDLFVDKEEGATEEQQANVMNLVMGTDGELVTMIDSDSEEVEEDKIIEGMKFGVENSKKWIEAQMEFVKKYKEDNELVKAEYEPFITPKEVMTEVKNSKKKEVEKLLEIEDHEERAAALKDIEEDLYEEYEGEYSKDDLFNALNYLYKKLIRDMILNDKKRIDGRAMDEIREISIELGVLPRAHGSAVFTRGGTQALTITTLGSTKLEQLIQGMEGEAKRRYMHEYNAPDYTVGQAGRYRYYPKRREVGHGALAEKALEPVIPSSDEFPYTMRVVSEVMSQRGSSSMASACASTLSLMDAGVPIKKPVAGIAMGVISDKDFEEYVVLTDIADIEDHFGDMDFKVTGTKDGVTAIQMDNKRKGLPVEIFEEGIEEAKKARMNLLEVMDEVIEKSRSNVSEYAPKIETIQIPEDKIGELIGPGGKTIRGLSEDTGAEINVEEDGTVTVASVDDEGRQEAIDRIEEMFEEPEIGKVYKGTVAKVMDFGAFVDINPSFSGLVHVSEMSDEFVKDPNTIVSEGDEVEVVFLGYDDKKRVKLSMKQVDQAKKKSEEK